MFIASSSTHPYQNWKKLRCFQWMSKQSVVHNYNGKSVSNEKEWTIDTWYSLPGFQRRYAQRKNAVSKNCILHDSFYIKVSKRQNYSDRTEQRLPGGRGGERGDYKGIA